MLRNQKCGIMTSIDYYKTVDDQRKNIIKIINNEKVR